MLKHLTHQTLEKIGFTNSTSNEFRQKIIQRLKSRKNLRWLVKNTIEDEVQQYYKDKHLPLYWGTPPLIHRFVTHKMSSFILKQCAQEHNVSLTNIRPDNEYLFIVHDYMCIWTLAEKHTIKLNQAKHLPILWKEKKYQQWKESLTNSNELIYNMIDQFKEVFSDWIDRGTIEQVSEKNAPVNSVLYRLKTG